MIEKVLLNKLNLTPEQHTEIEIRKKEFEQQLIGFYKKMDLPFTITLSAVFALFSINDFRQGSYLLGIAFALLALVNSSKLFVRAYLKWKTKTNPSPSMETPRNSQTGPEQLPTYLT